ncbi:aromatic-ring-hydroxylating dioxygenase subunit beta [Streptomyces sp. NA04227]|uniref:aromatic-ring-hydroxylating dioxygenase subunit beta n=1 Tax=Streptomyces sp. NA04227 TaxID=2742136 RepID=UPI0015917E28|nr:aromatic-ring-hydroxylating dioxygenase subunit beta [Streptomyces sp. NA04227]QKW09688.1 aromatic-ring-hydroxylating dioxygenase subunit beta [Streptomyces sp. NA04227]
MNARTDRLLGTAVDLATRDALRHFYDVEARLLDAYDYPNWLPLLEEEFVYRVPVTVTRDDPSLAPTVPGADLVHESRDSLASLWARRFEPDHIDFAWGEVPLHRIRRFVTNVVAEPGTREGEYVVHSNVLISVVHQSDPAVLAPAGRRDVVRRRRDGWGLVSRTAVLDESVIRLPHLRMVI